MDHRNSHVSCANAMSPRRQKTITKNRRADYLSRIAAAQGDPRLKIAHAADAVRAAYKNLPESHADRVATALLALAGLSENDLLNAAAADLLQQAGHPAAARDEEART